MNLSQVLCYPNYPNHPVCCGLSSFVNDPRPQKIRAAGDLIKRHFQQRDIILKFGMPMSRADEAEDFGGLRGVVR